jgi:hypothetical protein
VEAGVYGRQTEQNAKIAVAAQEGGRETGRIQVRRMLDASAEGLISLVENFLEVGSVVHRDGPLENLPQKGQELRA